MKKFINSEVLGLLFFIGSILILDFDRKDIMFTQYQSGKQDLTWNTNAMGYEEALDHMYEFMKDNYEDYDIIKIPRDTSLWEDDSPLWKLLETETHLRKI